MSGNKNRLDSLGINCPLPRGFSPHYHSKSCEATLNWAQKFNLVRKDTPFFRHMLKTDPALNIAHIYHDNYGYDDFRLLCDFCSWLCVHDDLWTDKTRISIQDSDKNHRRLLEVLLDSPVRNNDHPIVLALHDICERIRAYRHNFSDFIVSMISYITQNAWEVRQYASNSVPGLREYIELRKFGGGMFPFMELGVVAKHIHFEPWVKNHACIRALSIFTNDIVCWYNDIVSLYSEIEDGNTANLVLVLQHVESITLDQAIGRVVEMCNSYINEYQKLQIKIRGIFSSNPDQLIEVEKYIGIMDGWIGGYYDYVNDSRAQRFILY